METVGINSSNIQNKSGHIYDRITDKLNELQGLIIEANFPEKKNISLFDNLNEIRQVLVSDDNQNTKSGNMISLNNSLNLTKPQNKTVRSYTIPYMPQSISPL